MTPSFVPEADFQINELPTSNSMMKTLTFYLKGQEFKNPLVLVMSSTVLNALSPTLGTQTLRRQNCLHRAFLTRVLSPGSAPTLSQDGRGQSIKGPAPRAGVRAPGSNKVGLGPAFLPSLVRASRVAHLSGPQFPCGYKGRA